MEPTVFFKAVADPTRQVLLERLLRTDGLTLGELSHGLDMSRFGVMKHLAVLEDAGLVRTVRAGRLKLHYLNLAPFRSVYEQWLAQFFNACPGTGQGRVQSGGESS